MAAVEFPDYAWWETLLVGKKRGLSADVAWSQPVRIFGVHLSHRSEALRVHSAELLLGLTADSPHPAVIAGDLNSTPPGFPHTQSDANGNNAITTFDQSTQFRRSPLNPPNGKDQLTFHAARPYTVIDWILVPDSWSFQQYEVEQSQLSDHRPVWADVVPRE